MPDTGSIVHRSDRAEGCPGLRGQPFCQPLLESFWECVGEVDFCGECDGLSLYPDPLAFYGGDLIRVDYDSWQDQVEEDGPEATGPFEFVLAPDRYMKGGASGTTGPRIELPCNTIDCEVKFGDGAMMLSDYLRNAAQQLGLISEPWDSPIYALPSAQALRHSLEDFSAMSTCVNVIITTRLEA